MKIHPTGFDDYIEDDRPALHAEFGSGNTAHLEVHLAFIDPEDGSEALLGWFRVSELQQIINTAIHGRKAA